MARKLLYPKSKKGISEVVVTVILIALSLAAVVVVWTFVSTFINKQVSSSQSCFGNYDKVKINAQYTCYETLTNGYNLRFSLTIGDVSVDKVIVSVSSAGAVNSYTITNIPQTISGLVMYSGSNPDQVVLPGKNSGLTYNATGFSSKIDSIKIAPIISGNLCEVSDSLSEIYDCSITI